MVEGHLIEAYCINGPAEHNAHRHQADILDRDSIRRERGVLTNCLKGRFADIMLHAAGIFASGRLIHAKACEKHGERLMPVVDTVGNIHSLVCQGD